MNKVDYATQSVSGIINDYAYVNIYFRLFLIIIFFLFLGILFISVVCDSKSQLAQVRRL